VGYSNHQILIDFDTINEKPIKELTKWLIRENEDQFENSLRDFLSESETLPENSTVRIPLGHYESNLLVDGIRMKLVSETDNQLNFILEEVQRK